MGAAPVATVRRVTLSDYYMGETEVTQAQWRAVMGSDPSDLGFKGCDACPVEGVSWDDV
jgi:formylglycine-generating enzyme required for sulfatase activity